MSTRTFSLSRLVPLLTVLAVASPLAAQAQESPPKGGETVFSEPAAVVTPEARRLQCSQQVLLGLQYAGSQSRAVR